ncbi:MAG: diaminopimelate epimerase, partial [Flavobacteriales bacterium]
MDFWKYQGAGNDFVMVDDRQNEFNKNEEELINNLCDRRFGIGADGLILLRISNDLLEMIYFNSDGRPSS